MKMSEHYCNIIALRNGGTAPVRISEVREDSVTTTHIKPHSPYTALHFDVATRVPASGGLFPFVPWNMTLP